MKRRTLLAMPAALLAQAPRLSEDPDRPQTHLLPPANWMNDPNAPVWHGGRYHMYYQHNPKAAKWDTMHWGHAVSPDLVHWEHRPIALRPTPGGPDKDGCFTGCMVIDRGTPTIIYTGVRPEVQCVATSLDMQNWQKLPRAVLDAAPPGVDTPGFRDPHVWREGSEWLMLVGAGFKGKGGTALLYSSKDLRTWTYLNPLLIGKINPDAKGGDVARGEMWECPDFFPVGDKWLFYVSTEGTVKYWLGRWERRVFTPESEGVLAHGAGYAPKSCLAADGKRRLIWFWLREQRSGEEQLKAGWSGVMSYAAVPSLDGRGRLQLEAAREYQSVRGGQVPPSQLGEDLIELEATVEAPFKLSRGGRALLEWDAGAREIRSGETRARVGTGSFRLRVFIDGSVIEAYTDAGVTLAGRVYGTRGRIQIQGAAAQVRAWTLAPISKDRLTGT